MIDWGRIDELREEVGEEDLAEVIELFCEEVEEVLETLHRVQPSEISDKIHFLKGSAQNIGFSNLAECCVSIEDSLRSNAAFSVDVTELKAIFCRARSTLSQKRVLT